VPYRNVVAQARLGISQQDHEAFFRQMLGDVDEPTAPFGLLDVQSDGSGIEEAHLVLDDILPGICASTRAGWASARPVSAIWPGSGAGQDLGPRRCGLWTVLFGRMQAARDRTGHRAFINTLPVRISVNEEEWRLLCAAPILCWPI